MNTPLIMEADKTSDAATLVRDIQSQCRRWFAAHTDRIQLSRTGIQHPLAVSILLKELALIELHLHGDSFLNPTELLAEHNQEAQLRGDLIASVEQMLRAHPNLECQLRPDLDCLWRNYLPQTDSR